MPLLRTPVNKSLAAGVFGTPSLTQESDNRSIRRSWRVVLGADEYWDLAPDSRVPAPCSVRSLRSLRLHSLRPRSVSRSGVRFDPGILRAWHVGSEPSSRLRR